MVNIKFHCWHTLIFQWQRHCVPEFAKQISHLLHISANTKTKVEKRVWFLHGEKKKCLEMNNQCIARGEKVPLKSLHTSRCFQCGLPPATDREGSRWVKRSGPREWEHPNFRPLWSPSSARSRFLEGQAQNKISWSKMTLQLLSLVKTWTSLVWQCWHKKSDHCG